MNKTLITGTNSQMEMELYGCQKPVSSFLRCLPYSFLDQIVFYFPIWNRGNKFKSKRQSIYQKMFLYSFYLTDSIKAHFKYAVFIDF